MSGAAEIREIQTFQFVVGTKNLNLINDNNIAFIVVNAKNDIVWLGLYSSIYAFVCISSTCILIVRFTLTDCTLPNKCYIKIIK